MPNPGEPTIVVGARVEDLPDPPVPSVEYRCHLCAEPMWLSINSEVFVLDLMKRGVKAQVTCPPCTEGILATVPDEEQVFHSVPNSWES